MTKDHLNLNRHYLKHVLEIFCTNDFNICFICFSNSSSSSCFFRNHTHLAEAGNRIEICKFILAGSPIIGVNTNNTTMQQVHALTYFALLKDNRSLIVCFNDSTGISSFEIVTAECFNTGLRDLILVCVINTEELLKLCKNWITLIYFNGILNGR